MCGICGTLAFTAPGFVDRALLEAMNRRMTHRGPDDEGYYLDDLAGLAMRRLSIIDLAGGRQPLTNEDRTLWIVFNGEIYNYPTLRRQLEARGHRFQTSSDTEVILHAYEEFGDACPGHLNGMFAFAIWDTRRQRMLLARDHVGIKPLYYWHAPGRLVFGSELKSLLAHPAVPRQVDPAAIDMFLTLEYIPAPHTIVAGVHKLLPGHHLVVEAGGMRCVCYWDVTPQPLPSDEHTASEQLAALIDDAVQMQLISDVPLGALLSGGIDSSSVVASMSRVAGAPPRTFSIGFDDQSYNELPYARAVARQYDTLHTEQVLTPQVDHVIAHLATLLDEPFGDFSIIPTYLVSAMARQHVKVVLSGDGGDELFAGYDTYVAQRLERYYRLLPATLRRHYLPALLAAIPPRPEKKGLINKLKRFVEGASLPPALQHTRWMLFLNDADRAALYQPQFRAALTGEPATALIEAAFARAPFHDALARQQYVDIKTYLPDDILTKVDRMSMAASLEARVPLLDYRIVEFALNLPPEMKLHHGQTKRMLRRAVAARLPPAVLRKPKQGFSIPIKHWLAGPLQPLMHDLVSPERLRQRGYFEPACVHRWMRAHLEGRANHSHRLWALMMLELWHQHLPAPAATAGTAVLRLA